jgi:hypothetical protein
MTCRERGLKIICGHLYKLRSSQAQTIFGPAKALGPKE